MKKLLFITFIICFSLAISSCSKKWSASEKEGYVLIEQKDGPVLGYSASSGVNIITKKGYAFKDLNKNGKLDPYENWQLPIEERAADLAKKMSVEQIAGLMLYSSHQAIPASGNRAGTYGGKSFEESGADASDISDAQMKFLVEDNLRHVLVTSIKSPRIGAEWNNKVQALVEGIGLGIPANNSSDPRHGATANAEYDEGNGGTISMWPGSLGLAATFDPEVTRKFGEIASIEYRALGISTALSPQIDLATEPRWSRVSGTFGEDPQLSSDMAQAYCDGFQTTYNGTTTEKTWGNQSVNAMIKHWPGGGTGEAGRDAHYGYGKYAVYPSKNFDQLLTPFVKGAFNLQDGTESAAAVMPYYTISYGQDPDGDNFGNSYSSYIINDLLRTKYNFKGVVCTDWGITADEQSVDAFTGKCWGVEDKTVAERHYQVIMSGVDQFGGNDDKIPVIEAYELGVKEHGEQFMRERFEASARRLLTNIFRVGLFENPYLDPSASEAIVGNSTFMKEGFDAQVKSIVMLKNKNNTLPIAPKAKVYIEKRINPAGTNWYGQDVAQTEEYAVNIDVIKKFYTVVDNPQEADFGMVFISSPSSGSGYSSEDVKKGGNGYVPISLQYMNYTATYARSESIAGGDPYETFTNRSYKGKTVTTSNINDMHSVIRMRQKMGRKPVVVAIAASKPMVMGEFETYADAILMGFGIQNHAFMEIVSGNNEPSGLLPLQMPINMKTVEEQAEDAPHDMICYTDSEGHTYDFAYGMNWSGVIKDNRVEKYAK